MGWFDNTLGAIGGLFEDAGAAVGDVVENIGTAVLGPAGTRGSTLGAAVGSAFGSPIAGAAIGAGITRDISSAQQRLEGGGFVQALTAEDVSGPVTQADYENLQRGRAVIEGRDPFDEGTVIDIRYPSEPRTAGFPSVARPRDVAIGTAIGAGMDFIETISDYFTGSDDAGAGQMMCPTPARQRAFTVNRQTGCISITRKQQAKLKELVRMVGIEQASKSVGLPVRMVSELLMKTFRQRRRGISGADIKAVKRVDRQMHSLACALGGISQTSRAVASRKSPPKRSC
jgi:hypothetical protein